LLRDHRLCSLRLPLFIQLPSNKLLTCEGGADLDPALQSLRTPLLSNCIGVSIYGTEKPHAFPALALTFRALATLWICDLSAGALVPQAPWRLALALASFTSFTVKTT
jgi:hypothetical protein